MVRKSTNHYFTLSSESQLKLYTEGMGDVRISREEYERGIMGSSSEGKRRVRNKSQ
jgi:hypothetical protein